MHKPSPHFYVAESCRFHVKSFFVSWEQEKIHLKLFFWGENNNKKMSKLQLIKSTRKICDKKFVRFEEEKSSRTLMAPLFYCKELSFKRTKASPKTFNAYDDNILNL